MATKNPRISVTLDTPLYEWIERIAESRKTTMSRVIRDLIKETHEAEAWYRTEEWQKGEREAQEDIRLGRYKDFDTAEDFIKDLKS